MKNEKFSILQRLKSFKYAINGLKILINKEHNARVHLFAGIYVIIIGVLLKVSSLEWIAISIVIGFVIALEALNSAIENIADFISPGQNEQIKKIKDLSSAAVLIGAITACVTGLIVFIPKLYALAMLKK